MSYELNPQYKTNKNSCLKAQSFCPDAQKVSQLFNMDQAFPQIQQNKTLVTSNTFQEIKNLLQEIHDYGLIGEEKDPNNEKQNEKLIRTPEQEKINNITVPKNLNDDQELEKIIVEYYNNLLDVIDDSSLERLESNTILTAQDFANLKDLISSYEIKSQRCNVCNADKNCPSQSATFYFTNDGKVKCLSKDS